MKKIVSLALAAVMLFSMIPTAFAAEYQTTVSVDMNGSTSYTVTVPASLAPGGSDYVTLSGVWPSSQTITVAAPETVTLTNSIDNSETRTLGVDFEDIVQVGKNDGAQTVSHEIKVDAMDENVLFGTWTGVITYTITLAEDEVVEDEDNGETTVCSHANTATINAVAAKCNAAGYTGDTYCNDCQTTIATGTAIEATGVCTDADGDELCDDCGADLSDGEESTLITFTIDGVSYQAEEGMTWGMFIESDYNDGEFSMMDIGEGILVAAYGNTAIKYNNTTILLTKAIIAGAAYTT